MAALVAEHRLFTSLLAAGALLRLAVLVTYRPAFLFSDDSYWYLDAASRVHLNPVRPYVYSAFLMPLLPLHNLLWITAAQHLIGLASAVIAYALMRRLGLGAVWASIGAVPLLFDPLVLTLEQFVMAETVFVFLTVLTLAVLLWNARPGVRTAAIVGLLVAATALTRTVGMTTMLPALFYIAAGRRWRPVAVLLLAFALPMVVYVSIFRAEYGQFGVTDADGRFLYGRVAPFANCDGLSMPSYERELCPTPGEVHSPNWYTWRAESPLNHLAPGVSIDRTARDFAIRVILHQPGDYLRTVWNESGGVRAADPDVPAAGGAADRVDAARRGAQAAADRPQGRRDPPLRRQLDDSANSRGCPAHIPAPDLHARAAARAGGDRRCRRRAVRPRPAGQRAHARGLRRALAGGSAAAARAVDDGDLQLPLPGGGVVDPGTGGRGRDVAAAAATPGAPTSRCGVLRLTQPHPIASLPT